MKTIPAFLFLLMLPFVSAAQQVKESEVPAAVKAVALKQSNNQPVTMWVLDKKRGKYVASVINKTGAQGIEIALDGKWIETTTSVLPSRLPAPVMKAANDGFAGYDLDNFFYITSPNKPSYYTIDASSDDEDLTLSIDPSGKILEKKQR